MRKIIGPWPNAVCEAVCRGPKKHGARRDHRACKSNNTPALYEPAGCEVRSGQRLSMPGRQSYLHKRLPIGKLPQTGPYTVPFCTKAHNQRDQKHWGVPRRRPDPMSYHHPGCLPPRLTGVLTQCPPEWRQVAFPTGARRHHPCSPSTHWDRPPRPRCTGGRWERQNKFKSRQPTNVQTVSPSPSTNLDSDVTLLASIGESNNDSDYVELAENSPTSPANKPDLEGHISELEEMHKAVEDNLVGLTQPTVLFSRIWRACNSRARRFRDQPDGKPPR